MVQSRADAEEAVEKKRLDQDRITHYLKDKSITDTRNQIIQIIKAGSGGEARTISLMDTKLSFAVLLRIFLELDGVYKRELAQAQAAGKPQDYLLKIQKTLAVIDDAVCIFGETHRVLLMTFGKLPYLATLKSKVNHIVAELKKLVIDSNNIEITEQAKPLWQEASLWLYSIYKKTADKIKKQRPCHRVVSTLIPSQENLDKIPLIKHNASYIRYSDKLYYVNQDENINTEIKMTREKLVRFDVSSTRALSDKELKLIATLTQHQGPKLSHLVVMTSPEGEFDMSDLLFLRPKSAYVRRGNDLYYVNKDTKSYVKLDFNNNDGLKRFDKELKVASGLRPLTESELVDVTTITGHAHSRAEVVFRLEDDTFDYADPEDVPFKKATGGKLTKMEISLYYQQAVEIINRLIAAFDARLVKKPEELRQSAPAQIPNLGKTKTPVSIGPTKINLPRAATLGSAPAKPVKAPVSPVVEKKPEPVVVKPAAPVVKQPVVSVTAETMEETVVITKPVAPVVSVTAETYEENVVTTKPETPVVNEPVVSVTAETFEETVVTTQPVAPVVTQPVVTITAETFEETVVTEKPVQLVVEQAAEPVAQTEIHEAETVAADLRVSNESAVESEDAAAELSEVMEPSVVSEVETVAIPVVAEPADIAQASEQINSSMSVKEVGDNLVYSIAVAREHEEFLREIADVANDMMANPLVDALKQNIESEDKVKISTFAAALATHHLTPSQKASLSNFREDAISEINKYLYEKKSLFNYVRKAHKKSAEDSIAKLIATEDTEDHLVEVFRLNGEMFKKKSVDLYQYTSNALLMARERLCPNRLGHHLAGKTSIIDKDDETVMLQVEVSKDHSEFLQEIYDMVVDMTANPLLSLLKRDLYIKDDRLRISNLQAALQRFNFNPAQRAMLCNFRKDAIDVLESYKEGWWPAHYQAAKETIDNLNDEAKAQDPREQIMIMISLYRDMYGQTSDKLFKGINKLLIDTLEMICPKPRSQQNDLAMAGNDQAEEARLSLSAH